MAATERGPPEKTPGVNSGATGKERARCPRPHRTEKTLTPALSQRERGQDARGKPGRYGKRPPECRIDYSTTRSLRSTSMSISSSGAALSIWTQRMPRERQDWARSEQKRSTASE
jgi:hypothetical protein